MPHSSAVEQLLRREWHAEPGAAEDELTSLETALPFQLPSNYRELLIASNGGEGPLAVSPLRLCLYDVAFAKEIWRDPFYREQFADYFFIGSNGGGESIGIEISSGKAGCIVDIDCIAGEESKEVIARDFCEFISMVGRRASGDA